MVEVTAAPVVAPPAYKLAVNEARGEVRLVVKDVELVIAAEMGRLSAVSSRLQCKSFNDLFQRLTAGEVAAVIAGIELLTTQGDAIAAINKLRIPHLQACSNAFSEALAHHFEADSGNVVAAKTAA